jgi:hypothetical protein
VKNKTYICKECKKELRCKEVTETLYYKKLCPQCYTKIITGLPHIDTVLGNGFQKGELNTIYGYTEAK